MKGKLGGPLSTDLGYFYQPIFDKVFELYAPKDAWSLSILSHGEISWQRARQGIPSDQNSSRKLSTSDIQEDAARIRLRRYLLKEKTVPVWDQACMSKTEATEGYPCLCGK